MRKLLNYKILFLRSGLNQVLNDSNNNNNNIKKKDMNSKYLKISLCDCNTGQFITTMTKLEIDYIFQVIVKSSVVTGDWITDEMKEEAINTLTDIKNHYDETFVASLSSSNSSNPSPSLSTGKCFCKFNNK